MSNSTTVLRISFALALLSATLILLAHNFGFLPNEEKAERAARASIAEALAIQVLSELGQSNLIAVKLTISNVVSRNKTIQSIALRRMNGEIVAKAGDHTKNWIPVKNGISTPTHIYVPVNNGLELWGALEMSFLPLPHSAKILGIPVGTAILIGLLAVFGLLGNFFVLKRSLRELDPGRVVPERVQKAFDTLAEGVLILDDRGQILLSNKSFAKEVSVDAKNLIGTVASDLPWHQINANHSEFPWLLALRDSVPIVGASLELKNQAGEIRNLTVNATRISDDKGSVTGVIVTFDDVTEIEIKNNELNQLVSKLKEKEVEVNLKNRELLHLATRDPLTDCLNRRAFFDSFKSGIENARKNNTPVYCMMLDLDHFKNVNDQYGHAIGDEVIVLMGDILKSACRETDLAGRYGGEEFCLAMFGLDQENCHKVADRIRLTITSRARDITILERSITTSIGMVKMGNDVTNPNDLVDMADKALYAAKTNGRNRVVDWKDLNANGELVEPTQQPAPQTLEQIQENAGNGTDQQRRATDQVAKLAPAGGEPSMPFVATPGENTLEKLFFDRVSNSMDRANRENRIAAVVYVKTSSDLTGLGEHGHEAEPEINQTIQRRVASVLRKSDSVSPLYQHDDSAGIANLSYDTFAVLIPDILNIDSVVWIIRRLAGTTATPVLLNGQSIPVSSHVGVSLYPGDADDAEKLLERSRAAASYCEENLPANSHFFYSKDVNEHSQQQLIIEHNLRLALQNNELILHYQPIMNLQTGNVDSIEALLRCTSPALNNVPTTMLISIAEQSGLIFEIGEWSITHAIAQHQAWENAGIVVPKIAVNFSNVQLSKPITSERLLDILSRMNFDPTKLQLEIKEDSLLGRFTTGRQSLQQLQGAGVQISIDDFGSGDSSLKNIKQFAVDCIKIDQTFVQEIVDEQSDVSYVAAIIAMSQALGIKVIAEGVETEIQMARLVELKCDYAQGHLISVPTTAAQMSEWLRLFTPKSAKNNKLWQFNKPRNPLRASK